MQVSKYTFFKHIILYTLDYISGRFILQDIVVAVAVEQEEKYTIFNLLIENIHFLREIIQRHVPSECFFEKKKNIQFTRNNSIFYIFKKVAI